MTKNYFGYETLEEWGAAVDVKRLAKRIAGTHVRRAFGTLRERAR